MTPASNAQQRPDLRPLFAPSSIAVVGASTRPTTFTYQMVRTMAAQLEGIDLVAVNPRADEVAGVVAVPTLDDAPKPPDLVVVATPAATVPDVLDQAADLGAGAAIILSSGFAEVGPTGAALQDAVSTRASMMAILGPNCQGMMYRPSGLVATFTPSIRDVDLPPPAPIGYVGQSGALGGAFADSIRERGTALSAWVSTGNQVGVSVVDAALYLVEERQLRELFIYLEDTPNGASWTTLCQRAAESGCALTVLRTGRSVAGQAAVASHTGSLVGDQRAFDAVSVEHGVRFVQDIDELAARALVCGDRAPGTQTERSASGLVVLSSSGGAGAIAADQAERHGVQLAVLEPDTEASLRPLLPAFASTTNPIDVTAQLFTSGTAELGAACQVIASDRGVGHILVILSLILDPGACDLADDLVRTAAELDVPLSVVWLASRDRTAQARRILATAGIEVFDSVGAVMGALAPPGPTAQADSNRSRATGRVGTGTPPEATDVVTVTLEHGGLALLDEIGIPRPAAVTVESSAEAEAAVAQVGDLAVMKLGIPGVAHKSELDAVCTGVGKEQAAEVYRQLSRLAARMAPGAASTVVVYETAQEGVELLVNVEAGRDGYPPTITVGWGGTLVEILDDVTTFTANCRGVAIERALQRLRCWRLLRGWRGAPAADTTALVRALEHLAEWATAGPSGLLELELNPVRVHPVGLGVTALDLHATFSSDGDGA